MVPPPGSLPRRPTTLLGLCNFEQPLRLCPPNEDSHLVFGVTLQQICSSECWSKSQNCPALLRRLGNGLMNLPRYQADYNLAKEVLHRAEELSKHAVTYHILGTYYFRFEQVSNCVFTTGFDVCRTFEALPFSRNLLIKKNK